MVSEAQLDETLPKVEVEPKLRQLEASKKSRKRLEITGKAMEKQWKIIGNLAGVALPGGPAWA